ncbi:hypothetical protein [Halotalea alkalilenta]|uniref:Uncharacterized protein n=1 Tax=Halotalea alkalilenta TaxID=376489 RepID=A0A172YG85_9GAMM|nr:hypothetical protein [Halotalea alkalilenta]ANF58291.1 hypothetical protein A5892_13105 [Halotalea alkalilenta]
MKTSELIEHLEVLRRQKGDVEVLIRVTGRPGEYLHVHAPEPVLITRQSQRQGVLGEDWVIALG